MMRNIELLLCVFCVVFADGLAMTCDTCDSQCATAGSPVELSPTKRCRCDALCAAYGDCCSDRPTCADDASSLDGLQCKRTENIFLDRYIPLSVGLREAYWMISSCPEEWLASGDAQRSEIRSNCNASYARFPPVSDYNTGVVYKNEYCAVCNGVEKSVRWRYGLGCTRWLSRELQLANESSVVYNLTVDLLYRECIPCSYEPPDLPSLAPQPRACYPHIDSCLGPENVAMPAEEYRLAVSQCASEPLNPVWAKVGSRVFRNHYCAMCNGEFSTTCASLPGEIFPGGLLPPVLDMSYCEVEAERRLGHQRRPPSLFENGTRETLVAGTPFSAVLDINKDGLKVSSKVVETTIPVTCGENQLYDPVLEDCRSVVCAASIGDDCTSPSNVSCETGLIQLTKDDDFVLVNNSTVIYGDIKYDVVELSGGDPVICANLSANGTITRNVTEFFYNYPTAYFILTYVGCSLSLVGVTLILLSLALFKELRTPTTVILTNLSASIIVTNLFILIGGPVAEGTQSSQLCVSVSIVLHFFFLAQFSWMTVMSVEIAHTLLRGVRLRVSPSSKTKRSFLLYLLLGWGIPLAIVTATLAVNYAPSTSHLVLYGRLDDGRDGLCWINHMNSAIVAFVVPISLSLLINLTLLAFISIILVRAIGNQMSLNHSFPYLYLRVYCAVFFSSGATWLFGFAAVIASRPWAWYPFIILNSLQGFMLFLAFMVTRKVAALYLFLISRGRLDYRSSSSSTTTNTSSKTVKSPTTTDRSTMSLKLKVKTENGVPFSEDVKATDSDKNSDIVHDA